MKKTITVLGIMLALAGLLAACDGAAPPTASAPEASNGPANSFGDGTFVVNKDIVPGTYQSSAGVHNCYWARLSGFGGTLHEIIANDNSGGHATVTIEANDSGFKSGGCGTWQRLSRGRAATPEPAVAAPDPEKAAAPEPEKAVAVEPEKAHAVREIMTTASKNGTPIAAFSTKKHFLTFDDCAMAVGTHVAKVRSDAARAGDSFNIQGPRYAVGKVWLSIASTMKNGESEYMQILTCKDFMPPAAAAPEPEKVAASAPEKAGAPRPSGDSDALGVAEARAFVVAWVKASAAATKADDILSSYAPEVDYYRKGVVTKSDVEQDKAAYFKRWPDRRAVIDGEVRVAESGNSSVKTISFVYTYSVQSGARQARGRASTTLVLQKLNGAIVISKEDGAVEKTERGLLARDGKSEQ
jgi:hypothetical protein